MSEKDMYEEWKRYQGMRDSRYISALKQSETVNKLEY